MIKYEDENEILSRPENEVIVPFLIVEEGENIEIEAYKGVKREVEELIVYRNINCFSKSGIDMIDQMVLPFVKKLGYEREICGKYRWYLSFTASSDTNIDTSLILGNTVKLSKRHLKLKNLLTFDLYELIEKRLDAFVVIEDGCVVSIATVNQHARGQNMLEMTVETAPGFRCRGYASSAGTALCSYLSDKGKSVAYVCSRYNRNSIMTAKKIGFEYVGRFYAYTAYKAL